MKPDSEQRRIQLALTPTPVQRLAALSAMLGAQIYCKRDDLTGFGFGGNKIRKLEYLLHEARQQGCDTLITCGSNQSNWCCMTAVAGAALGMEVHLILGGPVPEPDTGNIRLNRIAGAKMRHIDTHNDDELEAASAELTQTLRKAGRKPYRMIMGGSNGLGAQGYATAFEEIASFSKMTGIEFAKIFHATGSAGTQAGLIAGARQQGWKGDVIGIAVSRSAAAQQVKVRVVLQQMLAHEAIDTGKIIVDDRFVGGGYRHKTPGCAEAMELFARREGIFLDEVYTGKAAAGLIEWGRSGKLARDENVLFIHTGGVAQLFE